MSDDNQPDAGSPDEPVAESGEAEATTGEASAGHGLGGIDAGSPGGMGGVHVAGGTANHRPPGGVSPVQAEDPDQG